VTPAIIAARKAGVPHQIHEYVHESGSDSYGEEAAEKMGVPAAQVFKTLVVSLDGKELAVGIVPVSSMLAMKMIARAGGARKATMAAPADVERSTGYVLGGVSPLGQKKKLKTYIDTSAADFSAVYVSAGRRGLEIELAPADLKTLTRGEFVALAQ
jgi:Cys-tRNA(Pro)/Cys-tRNA(Cys) deacylase